jgi:hypothetical protein
MVGKAVTNRLTDVTIEVVFALADSRARKEGLKGRCGSGAGSVCQV